MNDIDFISAIVTVLGFYFAYYQWKKTNREKREHLMKVLEEQLNCLELWIQPYDKTLSEEQKFRNASPFKIIYKTGSAPLIESTLLEEISNVPSQEISRINQLHYDLKRIESLQSFRDQLTSSDIKLSIDIENDLIRYLNDCQNKQVGQDFNDFINTYNNRASDIRKKTLLNLFVHYGETLHCQIIGNSKSGARNHWEELNRWIKKEKAFKINWEGVIVTYLSTAVTIYMSYSYFKEKIICNNTCSLIIGLLLTIIIAGIISLSNDFLRFPKTKKL